MDKITIPDSARRWDCLSLGEVMLRLDPGEGGGPGRMGFFGRRRFGVAAHKFFTFVFNGARLPPREWEDDDRIIPSIVSASGKNQLRVLRGFRWNPPGLGPMPRGQPQGLTSFRDRQTRG